MISLFRARELSTAPWGCFPLHWIELERVDLVTRSCGIPPPPVTQIPPPYLWDTTPLPKNPHFNAKDALADVPA